MADPPGDQETDRGTGVRSGGGPTTGMPRWVKVFLIIVIVLAAGLIVTRLVGVEHGPGLHTPPDNGGGHTPPVEHGP